MKKIAVCLTFLAAFGIISAQAADSSGTTAKTVSPAQTAQQNRMKDCAARYHKEGIAKSQYKTFMSTCLKNPAVAPGIGSAAAPSAAQPSIASGLPATPNAPMSQTDKMKSCNASAKVQNLAGKARKDFMKACLSKK